ncbi:GNAT family N-acetyltransferase [Pseudoalteromonas luteoviolacea]|uniref:GNAT family N-acetyltransferase n=1 Tax=Pseudoalteromonas luteoviolacea TaxID=43657 RepID=UPI001151415E|nr:GNAT family protein [Pseudoalteromonas luteoviolacea]TQF70965.1 GNAT family N-acetyltransferase [Pseudoalteromonas luteoviolacea]
MTVQNNSKLSAGELVINGVEYAVPSQAPKSSVLASKLMQNCHFKTSINADFWPKEVPEPKYNQAWVEVYVTSILAWLHEATHSKLLDTTKPVYILQAGSQTYRLGLTILHKLLQSIESQGLSDINLCMIFTAEDENKQTLLMNHPDFGYFYEQQQAKIIEWDIYSSRALPLQAIDGDRIYTEQNPLVFIAHGVLSLLPQAVYQVHYQQVYRAEFASISLDEVPQNYDTEARDKPAIPLLWSLQKQSKVHSAAKADTKQLAVNWQLANPKSESSGLDDMLRPWLENTLLFYMAQGVNKTIAVPIKAAQLLNNIEVAFPRGVVQLVSDEAHPEFGLKLPQTISPEGIGLPIDIGLLHKIEENKGFVKHIKLPFDNKSLAISMSHKDSITFSYTSHALENACKTGSPAAHEHIHQSLQRATKALTESQIQAYVSQSNYDPLVMAIFLPRLLKEGGPINERPAWRELLNKVWENHVVDYENETFAFELGLLAIDLSHWALAKTCMLMRMEINGPSTACLHNLGLAAWATGDMEIAVQSVDLALELNPQDEQVLNLRSNMLEYLSRCDQLPWFDVQANQSQDSVLKLLPVSEQHLREYYIQYRRPDIAERLRGVRLRQFEQLQSLWHTWLEEEKLKQKAHFALVHAEFGFIGGVVIEFNAVEPKGTHGDGKFEYQSAHLSFWVGKDFQSRGFGKRSVSLIINHLRDLSNKLNISLLNTSAWSHNMVSRHILEVSGFHEIEKVKGEGVMEEVFYELSLR